MTPEAPRTRLDCVESDANPQGWSDTAQKPDDVDQSVRVARILGWEPRWPHRSPEGAFHGDVLSWKCAECGEWVDPIDRTSFCSVPWNPHWERDGRTRAGTPYDADDLLTWLRHHLLDGVLEWESDGVWIYDHGGWLDWPELSTGWGAGGPFPTLLAALEAAVLAAAGDETPNPEGDPQ